MHAGEWLNSYEMWGHLEDESGTKLEKRQLENWIGSGKIWCKIIKGRRYFDASHIAEVARKLSDTGGRAYSLHYDKHSGRVYRAEPDQAHVELLNSYSCGILWGYKGKDPGRQATTVIKKHGFGQLIGNEWFVERSIAEAYREERSSQ